MTYQNIVVETKGRVGIIRLNRPQALNALNKALIDELTQVIEAFDADDKIGCMLITGNDKAFAAGADIKEMADKPFIEAYLGDFVSNWNARRRRRASRSLRRLRALRSAAAASLRCSATSSLPPTPPSSVSRRSSSASFPGIGGTQRPDARGRQSKSDGSDLDRPHDGCSGSGKIRPRGARRAGGQPDGRGDESRRNHRQHVAAFSAGGQGSDQSRIRERPLAKAWRFERRIFHSLFATEDQKEGMKAFVEKRAPKWKNK